MPDADTTTDTTATATGNTATKAKSWRDQIAVHPAAEMFPLMSPDELRALGEEIRRNEMRFPIVFSKEQKHLPPKLLDGRNRLDGLETVGITIRMETVGIDADPQIKLWMRDHQRSYECALPVYVFDMCGDEPYTFVVAANLHRRHLTAEQKRDLIDKLLKATPEKSDRQIADAIKASPTTVGKRRKTLEDTGDVSTMDTRTDTKGRQQQAHKPPTKDPSISAIADRAEARSRENQRRQAVGNGVDPEASADQRKAEAQAEPPTDDGFDALLAAWCAASDAGQERLMLTVGLTRSKPHLVGEAECLQRTAPSAPVDGDPMPPIPDALEFLRRGAS